ncbi:ZP domain-containing protein [Lingula anatina]|uniref:ZP domain-containing protein n=1 Tax=Lingula anatina TaxID=7574 RepID=A0A1S3IWM3_LINAN|nr:ZP domain-containing protein [Lingula anatina]|eukprot:XP_013402458.1 ZP domain-containing protein [Lingula anatina]
MANDLFRLFRALEISMCYVYFPESTSTTLTKVKTTTIISDKTHHLEQTTAPYVSTSDNRIDCGANAIMVAIARDVVGPLGGDINLVAHLRDPQCTGKDNSSHILFTFSPDTCGTSARLTKDFVVYENDIFIKSSSIAQQQVSVSFENYVNTVPVVCKYDRKELLSISYKPHFRTLNVLEHGFGHLTFSLEQYHGVQFKVPYQPDDYPLSVDLKDQIYIRLGVRLAAANMSGMALRADSCKATSSLSPFSSEAVKLIDNGCPAMKELTMYPSNDPTEVLFGFPAFYFVRDIQQVYLHCEMQVCMQSDPTCSSSCQTPARGRRDVSGAFSSTYIVTQGPFQPKRDSKAKAAYVVAGCSIAAALTAITVAIITVTRSRRETRGYQEVATSEGDM